MGELCFSLQYVPGSGPLTVVVLEVLSLELAGESPPPSRPLRESTGLSGQTRDPRDPFPSAQSPM